MNFDLKEHREALWRSLAAAAAQQPFAVDTFAATLQKLYTVDRFWTYPGRGVLLRLTYYLENQQYHLAEQLTRNCFNALQSGSYRLQIFNPFLTNLEQLDRPVLNDSNQIQVAPLAPRRPYFEVLIIHPLPDEYEMVYRQQLASYKSSHDEFVYDIVFVSSAEDALTAVLANSDIQTCVYLSHVLPATDVSSGPFSGFTQPLLGNTPAWTADASIEINLCSSIRSLRPELCHILISEQSPMEMALHLRHYFDRILFHVNPFHSMHVEILNGIRNRYYTPFFDALQAYGRQPKSVFHALPLSRGSSVKASPWIHDMLEFYGDNIFLAETSSTQGGLDSLLDPTGAIKQAQVKTAETFGADASYFVTNGTSTSNKIVMQANLQPGDIVLISADCHKSIPYSVMLTGAYPIFLETYPLPDHDLYGGIDLAQIKSVMLDLQKHGRLDRLKQITLTNSTFDGLVYHCERFMMEILAIKPDVIFHWDEAWFAFGHFHPLYHCRTAMTAVAAIRKRMQNPEYQQFHAHWVADFAANPDDSKWYQRLYPDPRKIQLRVYVTQSTHKTLTSFRQGSMVHVADTLFDQHRFLEAFRIHTSTSPNYQIIASLDIARRQAALEGYHLVRQCILLSLQFRNRMRASGLLSTYFQVLDDAEMIPPRFRHRTASPVHGLPDSSLAELSASWGVSDFVIDPTRITVNVSRIGLDGTSFRQLLMTRYDIQVNKTSRNTVLFLMNIGATQATVDYLLQVLTEMASLFHQDRHHRQKMLHQEPSVPLPDRREFHPAFLPYSDGDFAASDIRSAYFMGNNAAHVAHVPLTNEILAEVKAGRVLVSASFVTPYPPGFPVIVPGQIITAEILHFFQNIRVREIHGLSFAQGFKVFRDEYLAQIS